MCLPVPTDKQNQFSHCTDQTGVLINSIQCRKKRNVSNRIQK